MESLHALVARYTPQRDGRCVDDGKHTTIHYIGSEEYTYDSTTRVVYRLFVPAAFLRDYSAALGHDEGIDTQTLLTQTVPHLNGRGLKAVAHGSHAGTVEFDDLVASIERRKALGMPHDAQYSMNGEHPKGHILTVSHTFTMEFNTGSELDDVEIIFAPR